jgi:3-phenylpropionate/trans-cinnamate dioxygenase ferredoxin reductase component
MNRPPLSKDYLKDKDQDDEILIHEKDFYEKNGIDVMLETVAAEVKFGHKQVVLNNGETLGMKSC